MSGSAAANDVPARAGRRVDALLARSPLQPLARRRHQQKLRVLAYHQVEDPAAFAAQLDQLAADACPVPLERVLAAAAGRARLPARAVLVTFDDADRGLLEHAVPLLRERGIPAVAFVVAGLLDGDEPFWWREVDELVRQGATAPVVAGLSAPAAVRALKRVGDATRLATIDELRATARRPASRLEHLRRADLPALEAAGVAVGNHSLTHPCLDRCAEEKIRAEVEQSHAILRDALGHAPAAFAYPNGNHDERVVRAVAGCGYEVGFLFDHWISGVPAAHPLLVSRIRVDASAGLDRFRILLSGLHPDLHRLRGRS